MSVRGADWLHALEGGKAPSSRGPRRSRERGTRPVRPLEPAAAPARPSPVYEVASAPHRDCGAVQPVLSTAPELTGYHTASILIHVAYKKEKGNKTPVGNAALGSTGSCTTSERKAGSTASSGTNREPSAGSSAVHPYGSAAMFPAWLQSYSTPQRTPARSCSAHVSQPSPATSSRRCKNIPCSLTGTAGSCMLLPAPKALLPPGQIITYLNKGLDSK